MPSVRLLKKAEAKSFIEFAGKLHEFHGGQLTTVSREFADILSTKLNEEGLPLFDVEPDSDADLDEALGVRQLTFRLYC
jgi:hypothetical protein